MELVIYTQPRFSQYRSDELVIGRTCAVELRDDVELWLSANVTVPNKKYQKVVKEE